MEEDHYVLGNNWLHENEAGIWELYVEGSAYERGVAHGKLAHHLVREQEDIFIGKIREMIPSPGYLEFLKYFVGFFNRNLNEYLDRGQQLEILGISHAASSAYDFVGPPFYRLLNYHAAHDIGHALQNMNLTSEPIVGCTAFAVKGRRSSDGRLLMGRNFDFHMGDRFARNKIIAFNRPDEGHPYMTVTWAGMTGAVSGMNVEGLAVTLNAAKSGVPVRTGTPVSSIAREILQHASNIEEAFEVASRYRSFVAESFFITSARDGEMAIIEKAPEKMALFRPGGDQLVCTNHFQSETFFGREKTQKHLEANPTRYRYERVEELLKENVPLDEKAMAGILRDRKGKNGKDIGMGNEMAVNQLLAHHSVIFKPEEKKVWLSTFPYQLGAYVAYDLDEVFDKSEKGRVGKVADASRAIPSDPFLDSEGFRDFREYERLRDTLVKRMQEGTACPPEQELVERFIASNPEYFDVYMVLGDLFKKCGQYKKASGYYQKALQKKIPRKAQREHVREGLGKCGKKQK